MHRLLPLTLLCLTLTRVDASKPNVVFIYTDDQAPFAVRAAGDKRFITPHIDRIFHEGAHLTQSFVTTPVCSPSRVGLICSRYGTEMQITDWINPQSEKNVGLPVDTVTFVQLFVQAGYRTGLFGKWHLGTADRYHPKQFGYQKFAGIRAGGCPPKNPVLETVDGEVKQVMGYTCDILTDHTLDFIRDNKTRPFLVSLHFRAPHAAWLPVRHEDWAPFKDLDPEIPNPDFPDLNIPLVKKRTREYLAAVKSVDRNVGRVLGLLTELHLEQNTIVIFTSDHGYNLGDHGVWFKGNSIRILTKNPPQKWKHIPPARRPNLWDTSLQVPTAIRWPGTVQPGTILDQTFSNLDWYPTLLAMADIPLPKNVIVRGNDFTPILRGNKIEWENTLFLQYSMHHGARTQMRGIRTPQWKFMIDLTHSGRAELYNLREDPHERNNLAHHSDRRIKDIRQSLKQQVKEHMATINDPASRRDF